MGYERDYAQDLADDRRRHENSSLPSPSSSEDYRERNYVYMPLIPGALSVRKTEIVPSDEPEYYPY